MKFLGEGERGGRGEEGKRGRGEEGKRGRGDKRKDCFSVREKGNEKVIIGIFCCLHFVRVQIEWDGRMAWVN